MGVLGQAQPLSWRPCRWTDASTRGTMLADILESQKRQRHRATKALSDIVADAQAFGDYDHPNR